MLLSQAPTLSSWLAQQRTSFSSSWRPSGSRVLKVDWWAFPRLSQYFLLYIKCSKITSNNTPNPLLFQQLYITCHLKATSTAYTMDSEHKACSYISGWVCVCACVWMKECDSRIDMAWYYLCLPLFVGGGRPVELMQFVAPVALHHLAFQLVQLGLAAHLIPGLLAADHPLCLILQGRSVMRPKKMVCQ